MQYLDAMGIEMFVPRKRLLGAKASRALPIAQPLAVSIPKPLTESPRQEAAIAAERHNTPKIASELVDWVRPTQIDPTPKTATVTPITPAKALRFSLNLWNCHNWLVIDSRQPHQALPTDTLLQNILTSIGYDEALPKTDIIHWPLIETPSAPPGWEAAREMMSAFLRTRLLNQPQTRLLLMGEMAFDVCTSGEDTHSSQLFSVIPLLNTQAWILPSLTQLLQQPSLKSHCWQLLAPLHAQP